MRSHCPFEDQNYEDLGIDDPCPVCGALGYFPLRNIEGELVNCLDEIDLQEEANKRFIKAYKL